MHHHIRSVSLIQVLFAFVLLIQSPAMSLLSSLVSKETAIKCFTIALQHESINHRCQSSRFWRDFLTLHHFPAFLDGINIPTFHNLRSHAIIIVVHYTLMAAHTSNQIAGGSYSAPTDLLTSGRGLTAHPTPVSPIPASHFGPC